MRSPLASRAFLSFDQHDALPSFLGLLFRKEALRPGMFSISESESELTSMGSLDLPDIIVKIE